MRRVLSLLCLCCLFGTLLNSEGAQAHMTSMGRFFVHVYPAKRTVELVLSISRDDVGTFLKLDKNADRRVDLDEIANHRDDVASYLAKRLLISNNGLICNVEQQRFLLDREKKSRRRLFFAQRVVCAQPFGTLLFQNSVMFDDVGGYRHLSRIQVGKTVYAPYFSRLSSRYVVQIKTTKTPASKGETKPTTQVTSQGEGWLKALFGFVYKGAYHIAIGLDHIAFVLCLLLIARSWSSLLWVITAFTVGHSITLILCVLNIVFLPVEPTEALIALTIAYVGVENILYRNQPEGPRFRYVITGIFGLIHGFGFSYTLREINLPREALVPSLLGFNLGIELGQIVLVALVYPWIRHLMAKDNYNSFLIFASSIITAIAMYWFVTRAFF